MAGQNELAQLETERDRLLSMIAYHDRRFLRLHSWRAPTWLVVGVSLVAGVFAGQISASAILFLVVGLPLFLYISTRKITVFGIPLFLGEIIALAPVGQPVGEIQARQRLAECETRILELKEGRP